MKKSNIRIITCAITGAVHMPSLSEYLPITPEEIAQDAIDAASAGATAVHIHARDPVTGSPSPDLELFNEIIERIREKDKKVIICITTGGGTEMSINERASVVSRFRPEMASMNCGSMNWGLFPLAEKDIDWKFDWEKPYLANTKDFIFKNTFKDMEGVLEIMNKNGTKPEFECYDASHIYHVKYFKDLGLIKGTPYIQFVLGVLGGIGASVHDLVFMKETADRLLGPDGYNWSAFGGGKMEFPICTTNLFLGGNVRVGMEDNLYLKKYVLAENNGQLVEKMIRIMREFDYIPASPDEGREILELSL